MESLLQAGTIDEEEENIVKAKLDEVNTELKKTAQKVETTADSKTTQQTGTSIVWF